MSKTPAKLRYYIFKRILQAIVIVLAIIIFNFVLIHTSPGNPAVILAGELADADYIAQLEREFGLDQPLHIQLGKYLFQILQGNLGYSFLYRQPVLYLVLERLQATLLLMLSVIAVSSVMGIIVGVIAAIKVHSWADNLVSILSMFGYALPAFWSGQLLLLVFSLYLGWFPMQGMVSLRVEYTGLAHYLDIFWHAFLPIANLSLLYLALIFRLTRANLIENLNEDYIMTARAKGLPERSVVFKHALRNSLLPIVTVIGMHFGTMIGGAIITETIFGWPGVGRLVYDSIQARDYPVLMGVFTSVGVMVIVVNIVTDIVYAFIDPRIRYR